MRIRKPFKLIRRWKLEAGKCKDPHGKLGESHCEEQIVLVDLGSMSCMFFIQLAFIPGLS